MAAQSIGTLPARRNYKPEVKPASFCDLPFVYRPKRGSKNSSNWHMPPTDDYASACDLGREYAAHFIQFLKDNPFYVGSNCLGSIMADVDFKDESDAKGYWVGFFSHLERYIYATAKNTDVFADVDQVKSYYAEAAARAAVEEEITEE